MKLRPFDSSANEDFSMYDNLPYKKDIDLCGPDKIAMESGNVIKFFRYVIQDTYQLTGMDDLFYEKLEQHEKEQRELDADKTAIEKLADTLLPEDEFETVEEPQLAEEEFEAEAADYAPTAASDAEAMIAASQNDFWDDDWA